MIVFEDKRNGTCRRAEDKPSSEQLLGPPSQAAASLSGTRTRLKKKRWRAWNGPSHPEQLIWGLILKLSGSEASRVIFFFKKRHEGWKISPQRAAGEDQENVLSAAEGHNHPERLDGGGSAQVVLSSWPSWAPSSPRSQTVCHVKQPANPNRQLLRVLVRQQSLNNGVGGGLEWTQQRQQLKYSAAIFHQLLGVWTIRWGAVHLLDSSTQWLLFDRLTHIIDLMYYSSPNQLRNNRWRAQKMQSAHSQTDTGRHLLSDGALVLLCRWSQRAGISQQPPRLVSLKKPAWLAALLQQLHSSLSRWPIAGTSVNLLRSETARASGVTPGTCVRTC